MFEIDRDSFSKKEEKVLESWEKNSTFKKSMDNRKGANVFTFYDGPPFATGLPHYGHILAGTIKDVVARYKTMKGFYVRRRFGWDCHGLPIESAIEKLHDLSGAAAIEEFGIDKFNEECRSIVLKYTAEWKEIVTRMGRWVEFDRTWRTMDPTFMESVWWVFSQLWDKDLVYEGYKVMPVSPKLGTPLSNFEANLNYQETDDPSLTVLFPLRDEIDVYFMVWTTTPWTLVSNMALAVGEEIEYVKIRHEDKTLILAKALVNRYFKDKVEIVETILGKDLIGMAYKPLFDYFIDRASDGAFHMLKGDFISTADGTGIVHMAPAFGEDDYRVCKQAGIELVCPVDDNCRFTNEVADYEGQFVKDADKAIAKRIKEKGLLFKQATCHHRYPFCWRTDEPLIYKAVSNWFISVEKIKDRVIAANKKIHWVPSHIKEGRFGKWLENARDWAVSRSRYWGTPIPIWRSEDGSLKIISSIEELEKKTGQKIDDIHRHKIDHLTFEDDGKMYKRVPDVFDCWFESGSMPYAQNHYPFDNKEETEANFPADFIAEGLDQTRGWFYTLTVLATALFDQPAFKNVIVNGIILAEDGNKMSKRLSNYPDPQDVIAQYGSDAIRLYLLSSPVVQADDFRFCKLGVEGVLKQFLIPFWNAYVFFATYAKIYKWEPKEHTGSPKAVIDRWILSRVQALVMDVQNGVDLYQLNLALEPFTKFIDELTNWYIRRNRSRFWADEATPDRDEAFTTLYVVLKTLTKVAAPFVPFIAEEIFSQLEKEPSSVHLSDYPEYDATYRDEKLEKEMSATQMVVSAGHSLRKEHKLKVRQPLSAAHVVTSDKETLTALTHQKHLIMDELNVKQVDFHVDESMFVHLKPKANFRVLGKKVGKHMKKVKVLIEELPQEQLKALFNKEAIEIAIEGESISLTEEDILIERQTHEGLIAACVGSITIALDTKLNEDLMREGLARELINKLNTMRRNQHLDVTDRICVEIEGTEKLKEAYHAFKKLILGEVLALDVTFHSVPKGTEWDLNGEKALILVTKA